jgi:hypothetical protein
MRGSLPWTITHPFHLQKGRNVSNVMMFKYHYKLRKLHSTMYNLIINYYHYCCLCAYIFNLVGQVIVVNIGLMDLQ